MSPKRWWSMEFLDQEIVEIRRLKRLRDENKFYIKGEVLALHEVILFDKKMKILLPSTFTDMPLEVAKKKYPSENRPAIIRTNAGGDVNFSFNLLDQKLEPSQLEEVNNHFYDVIKQINPATIFYDKKVEVVNDKTFAWFDFKGYAIDAEIYYIYFVTTIHGQLLHGIFNCIIQDRDEFLKVVFHCIHSVDEWTEGEMHA